MSNRYARVLAAGCAAVLAATLAAAPALAAATWAIQPGGAITATSGKVNVKDTTTDTVLTCHSATASGTLKSGSGLPGSHAGALSTVGFTTCGGPGGGPRVQATDLPWHLNLSAYNAAKGVARGTVSHIQITLSVDGCTAVIDGTGATASDGKVTFRYADSTGRLTLLATGGNLHYYKVSGCLGLINSGDPVTLSATFTVTPKQAITSP